LIIAVSGGKGGTGKSTVAVNLALALAGLGAKTVLVDLDVECPNDHILLGVELGPAKPVEAFLPFIDYRWCTRCGACAEACQPSAIIRSRDGLPFVVPRLCIGCRACLYACPSGAILEGKRIIGSVHVTGYEAGGVAIRLVTGMLREGEEHAMPVVLRAREEGLAMEADVHVLDTAPGAGNAVAAAISGADLVVAVAEPTPLGAHDLDAILRLARELGVEAWVVVNKEGIARADGVAEVAERHGTPIIARIPYSGAILASYLSARPIVLHSPGEPGAREISRLARLVAERGGLGAGGG